MEAKVAIIICNYNKKDYVLGCIDSVFSQTFHDYDLYVVDNASADGSAEAIQAKYGNRLTLIKNPINLGGSGGFNSGMRQALKQDYSYLLLLDNDVTLAENALEELYLDMEQDSSIGFEGCKILKMDHPDILQEFAARVNYEEIVVEPCHGGEKDNDSLEICQDCDSLPACALLVRTEVIRKIGLMPEDNFVSWDDIEWCVRCIRAGYRVVANGRARAWHKGSVTVATNTFGVYYAYRNKIQFFLRYMQTENQTSPVDDRMAQSRADAILRDVFRAVYACTYSGKINRVKTVMDAFLDALAGRKGQSEDYQIRPNDIVQNALDAILTDVSGLVIDVNGYIENAKKILASLHQKIAASGHDLEIILYSSIPISEKNILGHPVLDAMPAADDNYLLMQICEHIFAVKNSVFQNVLIDGWCNIIASEDDLQFCKNYDKEYQLFKCCYEDRLVSIIMKQMAA